MKKAFIRTLSVFLAIALIIPMGLISVPATESSSFTYISGDNGISNSYKNSKFYEKLSKITLTGDGRTDVIAVALTQAGYLESNTAGDYAGVNAGSKDYCEYNYNMGDYGIGYGNGYHWCASFVSWALLQSGCYSIRTSSQGDWCRFHDGKDGDALDTSYIWREVGVPRWYDQMKAAGRLQISAYHGGNYIPQTGDLIFYSWDGTNQAHIGLVIYSDGTYVYTVEGNTSDAEGLEANGGCCAVKTYSLSSKYISGYGVLPYKEKASAKIDFSGKNRTTGYYINTQKAYNLYGDASCSGSAVAVIPRFTMFDVVEVCSNGMLKVVTEVSGGATKTGYINPASSRVFQLTSSSTEKRALEELVSHVKTIKFKDYTTNTLTELRTAYREAINVLNDSSSEAEDYVDAYNKLDALYKSTGANEATSGVYVTAFDEMIVEGACTIFTKAFNNGTLTPSTGRYTWAKNIKAKWNNELNAYVVTEIIANANGNAPDVTLAEDEIMISAHNWETGLGTDSVPPAVAGSADNFSNLGAATVGQKIIVNGIDFQTKTLEPGAYLIIVEADYNPDDAAKMNLALHKTYTISGSGEGYEYDDPTWGYSSYRANLTDGIALNSLEYNDDWFGFYEGPVIEPNTIEGVGSVVIDLGKNYNVTEIRAHLRNSDDSNIKVPNRITASVLTDNGDAYLPIGDFTLNSDGNAIYWTTLSTNVVCRYVKLDIELSSTFAFVNEIEVYGSEFTEEEPDGNEQPGNNPDGEETPEPTPEIKALRGDVNQNEKIDARDYLLLKRAFFKTYKLTCDDRIADINNNGRLDARDYLLLKRMFFGTYFLPEELIYVS